MQALKTRLREDDVSTLAQKPLLLLAGMAALLVGTSQPADAYTVYVSNEKDNTVSVIDADTMAVTATWKVGRRPRGITISNDGKWLFICASADGSVRSTKASSSAVLAGAPGRPSICARIKARVSAASASSSPAAASRVVRSCAAAMAAACVSDAPISFARSIA